MWLMGLAAGILVRYRLEMPSPSSCIIRSVVRDGADLLIVALYVDETDG